MKENILHSKSKQFAIQVIKLSKLLVDQREYILSKQIVRSGTAIGAMICESEFAQSRADFLHKLYVGLKEANETRYWLELLYETDQISKEDFERLEHGCSELIKLLVSITKTLKQKRN